MESFERKRLDHLIQAENIQRKFETKMTNNETSEFNVATRNFRKVQTQLEKENNFAFLDEGWKQEKEKIEEKQNLNQTRRDLDRVCAAANKETMARGQQERTEQEAARQEERERRLVWEEEQRARLEEEKFRVVRGQAEYHGQISQQRGQNSLLRARREENEESLCDQVRRNQKYFLEIDERETRQPLDKAHSFRK